MAEQASLVQEGVDRFREALDSIDLQRVQRQLNQRRKRIEKQILSGRRQWEKRTRQQMKRLRTELRNNSIVKELSRNALVKRVQALPRSASRQIESGVDGLLAVLRIASRGDLERLDRKLGQISRKLKGIEQNRSRGRTNGQAAAAG